jgi:hypothetical protein
LALNWIILSHVWLNISSFKVLLRNHLMRKSHRFISYLMLIRSASHLPYIFLVDILRSDMNFLLMLHNSFSLMDYSLLNCWLVSTSAILVS